LSSVTPLIIRTPFKLFITSGVDK